MFSSVRRAAIVWYATFLCLPVALLAVTPTAAPLPRYTVGDRGQSLVRTLVNTPGLNAQGVLAIWKAAPTGVIKGLVITPELTQTIVGTDEFPFVYPADINGDSTVVGLLQRPQDLRFTRAFKWSHNGLEVLPNLQGPYASAAAINAAGTVVGSAQTSTSARHAVLWQGAAPRDLGLLARGDYSSARDINDQGQVVGEANVIPNGKPRAFLWSGHTMQQLPLLPGGTFCSGQAINNAGETVGSCDLPEGSAHAVLWKNGTIKDLGTLGDEDAPSTALDINREGQIVGSSEVVDGKLRAVLWQSGRLIDLNTLIDRHSGWLLLVASRINDRGEIAGRGMYHGAIHAFVLEPSATLTR
ncbi:hypothetical protein [Acidipila sp. EB88]|uniref:hypothetical protein n=1 Tax=Acidipila sp. EB88 TaxID=2305226 RepID=UPI00131578B0|nr:hypothetical protein [Acidipila sp. EB88]